jgi:hypothetical protein
LQTAKPLASRESSHLSHSRLRLKGVHINDNKAMFLLRWYQELDKNGKVLAGYQNRGCKFFYLPLDNGGYPFEWVSNHQVLCAVHLSPTAGKNRTFTLPAGDRRTATEATKKWGS